MLQIKFIVLILMMVSRTTATPSLPPTNTGQAPIPLKRLNSLFDNYNLNQGKKHLTSNSLRERNNGLKSGKGNLYSYSFDLANQINLNGIYNGIQNKQGESISKNNDEKDFSFINAMQTLVQSNSHYFNTKTKTSDYQGQFNQENEHHGNDNQQHVDTGNSNQHNDHQGNGNQGNTFKGGNNNFGFVYQGNNNQHDNSNQGFSFEGFNQNHGNDGQENNKDDEKDDDKEEDDPYEKIKEDYEEFLKEEEKKEEIRVRDAQRLILLTLPFFLFDKPSAAYFSASELLSTAFEKMGVSEKYNLIIMLFVHCVDIVALKRGRFKLVEGYKEEWYKELMDVGMFEAGFTDLTRFGLLMMLPQSPKPTYEDEEPLRRRRR